MVEAKIKFEFKLEALLKIPFHDNEVAGDLTI